MKSFFKFLSRNKAYTAINVLGLAVALMFILIIGAYTWQETHIDTWHSKAGRTYTLGLLQDDGLTYNASHWRVGYNLKNRFPEIEDYCAVTRAGGNQVVGPDGEWHTTSILLVDSTFYSVFDFPLEEGDRASVLKAPNSAVVSRKLAQALFGGDDPIGKTIRLGQNDDSGQLIALTVTGVMEPMKNTMLSGDGMNSEEVELIARFENIRYYNFSQYDEHMSNAAGSLVFIVGAPGSNLEANAQIYNDYAKEFFWILKDEYNCRLSVTPLDGLYLSGLDSPGFREGNPMIVKVLFWMGVAILLFAIMNYINLTVAQATGRAKEMATRRLLGDSRKGIILRLIAESCLLVVVAFMIGLGGAALALPYAGQILDVTLHLGVLINPVTLTVGLLMLAAVGVAAGIVPAVIISSVKPIDIVRGTFRRHTKGLWSKILIVAQNVVTIVMLVCTLTMYLQVRHLVEAPLGFEYKDRISIRGLGNQIGPMKRMLESLGCVDMVVLSAGTPFDGGNNNSVVYEGKALSIQIMKGDENWLEFFGIVPERDNGNPDGWFVTHKMLADLGLPLDAELLPPGSVFGESGVPIRGVVPDMRIRNILESEHPIMIKIMSKLDDVWSLDVKIKGDPAEAWRQINEASKEVFNGHELAEFMPRPFMEQEIAEKFAAENRLSVIVGIFTLVAVIISMLGLVAMSTYYVQQRAREIAVRKVFGSTSGSVLQRLLRSFMTYVAVAIVIAVPVAWWLMSDWLSEYSYRIPLYWWIFAAAGAVCVVISLLSVWLQSWRAASANPVKALYQN